MGVALDPLEVQKYQNLLFVFVKNFRRIFIFLTSQVNQKQLMDSAMTFFPIRQNPALFLVESIKHSTLLQTKCQNMPGSNQLSFNLEAILSQIKQEHPAKICKSSGNLHLLLQS